MQLTWGVVSCLLLLQSSLSTGFDGLGDLYQHALQGDDGKALPSPQSISVPFFADLERLARLVDITYCVGTTGISPPFSCASRCKEFPSLQLASTWNTGVLMSDSCGYIAVDHGEGRINDGGKGGAVIVAFRGTYSITNTVVDLSTVPQEYVPYPEPDDDDDEDKKEDGRDAGVLDGDEHKHKCDNCTVHMGFLASWRQARKLVIPVLKSVRQKHPDYPIYLVGHSLGGAVAALASLELKVSLGWDDMIVTTFGEPRTGNKGFVRFLDKTFDLENDDGYDVDLEKRTYRRVTHVDDPVPLLPLTEWGYRSHAGEVYIKKPSLSPAPEDLRMCRGDNDEECMAGAESSDYGGLLRKILHLKQSDTEIDDSTGQTTGFPTHLKPWELFFAHRDYFWRLGLCLPGGDPADWGRDHYNLTIPPSDEL